MRRVLLSLFIVVSAAVAAAPGPNPGTGGILVPPAGPTRTLTGILYDRDFFANCNCYTWVVEKNNRRPVRRQRSRRSGTTRSSRRCRSSSSSRARWVSPRDGPNSSM